jgi:alkaline phosphatase
MKRQSWGVFYAVAAGALLVFGGAAEAAAPRNVIVLIGDGMGVGQIEAARCFSGRRLVMESLPFQADCITAAAGGTVTDSAAAATALATGYKVNNGVISLAIPANASYAYGEPMQTVLEYSAAAGKSTGLVSTAYITNATPAGFGAHAASRNDTTAIAKDYLTASRPNVLLGGGGCGMTPAEAVAAGYTVVTDAAGMLALDTTQDIMLSGQFGTSNMPYEYDGLGDLPHLSQMTATALQILSNDPDGFFLMIEGARIDEAGHNNDLPRNIGEVLEFDCAVRVVIDWAAGRTDTLVLVTADHETGGLDVIKDNGAGNLPTCAWSSTGHTNAKVKIYAWGVNAERVMETLDNTEIFRICTDTEPAALVPAGMAFHPINARGGHIRGGGGHCAVLMGLADAP